MTSQPLPTIQTQFRLLFLVTHANKFDNHEGKTEICHIDNSIMSSKYCFYHFLMVVILKYTEVVVENSIPYSDE